ncbi:MAG: Uma2 family endonuclease [Cyanobacteriota bacterium]|nr:Uma2 family endonuclease [Cyanobacteriota bacterium]
MYDLPSEDPEEPDFDTIPPLPPRETLPTMYDLPSEDPEEPGLPDEFHNLQPELLSRTFSLDGYSPQDIFIGTDLNLYYDVRHSQWYKRPDWFAVLGVPRLYEERDFRRSYVTWQEGVNPFVIVELLSPGTANEDLGETQGREEEQMGGRGDAETRGRGDVGTRGMGDRQMSDGETLRIPSTSSPPRKWEVYEQILRVPYYVVFSRYDDRLWFFQLVGGRYQEQPVASEAPLIWIEELQVGLGLWQGEYDGISRLWLRWCDGDGNWIPTDTEVERQQKEVERQQKEEAIARASQAESQLETVALNLLNSGMDVDRVAQLTQMSVERVRQLARVR